MIVPCLNCKVQNPPPTTLLEKKKLPKGFPLKQVFLVYLVYQTEIGSFFFSTLGEKATKGLPL